MGGYMKPYDMSQDPHLAQGLNSIAAMFKSPSPTDILAGAKVQQMRAEDAAKQKALAALSAGGRQDLVDIINAGANPDAYKAAGMARMQQMAATGALGRDATDQWGVASGLFNPSNSYGMEADRERTKLQQTGLQQQGEAQRTAMTNAAAMDRARMEQAAALERANLEQAGMDRRLSTDQTVARIMGQLSPEEQQNLARIKMTGTENVVGPNGKPMLATGVGALGAQPVLKPDQQTEITRLISERDALPAGSPNRAAYDARIAALGRGQQQSAYDKAQDEAFAKLNEDLFNSAQSAQVNLGTLNRIGQLIDPANTGKFANLSVELRKALDSMGVPTGGVADAELLRALGSQFALKLRDPSMGGGMPGSLSDSDRMFLASMAPGLENTPEGNRKLVDYFRRVSQRAVDVEKLRQQYIQQHGRLDEGFRSAVSQWAQQNPMFSEAQQAAPQFKILQVR